MPYKSAYTGCWNCGSELIVKNRRDVERKKFCSHSCRQIWRFNQGEWSMEKLWSKANTPEANAKKSHPAERNPNWIGDRRKVKRPVTSHEGVAWRKAVFERDDYICQSCGQRGGRLNAHHVKPYCTHPELRFDVSNGQTLCEGCHKQTPTYGAKMTNAIRRGDVVAVS